MKNKTFSAFLKIAVPVLFLAFFILLVPGFTPIKGADNEVRLNVNEVAITKDDKFKLRAYNVPDDASVYFRSSNQSVAIVNNKGYITGISNGECVITVTVVSDEAPTQLLYCNVTVGPAAISVKITKTEVVLAVGMKRTLRTIVSPLNTVEKPVFYCSDTEVAKVSSTGRVKARSTGEASVFALLMNGDPAECKVYVLTEEDYEFYIENGTLEGIIEGYLNDDDEKAVDTVTPEPTEEPLEENPADNKQENTDKTEKTSDLTKAPEVSQTEKNPE